MSATDELVSATELVRNAAFSYLQGNHEHVSEITLEVLILFPNHALALFELAMMYARSYVCCKSKQGRILLEF